MRKLIVFCTMLALLFAVPVFAAPEATATAHCPDHNGHPGKVEGGGLNGVVLPAGTVFCVKAGTGASGHQTSDGTTPLLGYITWTNRGGQTPDVSYYIVYSTPQEPPEDPDDPEVCEDPEANNYGAEAECTYDEPEDPGEPEEPTPTAPPCQPVRLYDLWRYRMENAPSWYFMGGTCWIKSLTGVPAPEFVVAQCSRQCMDPTFEWEGVIPEAFATVYVDCDGTVFSTDPLWNAAWVDLPYAQGEPATCYNAGCP